MSGVTFELRKTVVAIYTEPQRDEPPGRGNEATREVVLAVSKNPLRAQTGEVQSAVRDVVRSGGGV